MQPDEAMTAADTFRVSEFTGITDSVVAALQKRSQAYERQRIALACTAGTAVCGCVCVLACVRAHACVRAFVMCLQYTIIIFDPG